ncbi:hypothetical protein RA20_10790, partial [Leisingera sp. ANG-Vp]
IKLGHGSNAIDAGAGKNRISAGDGGNTVQTGDGKDDIKLGHGANTVTSAGGDNRIAAGNGQNTIETGGGADQIKAGDGGNTIVSGGGNDRIQTGRGDDRIDSGEGSDDVNAGAGYDVAVYSGSFDDYAIDLNRYRDGKGSISITGLADGAGDQGSDVLSGVEALYFEAEDFLFDLTDAGSITPQDSAVAFENAGDTSFAIETLMGTDWGQQSRFASVSFDAQSAGGVQVEFDGETVTYSAEDLLEGLGAGEEFQDSFTYTVTDLFGDERTATVEVTLIGENDGPVAGDDNLNGGLKPFNGYTPLPETVVQSEGTVLPWGTAVAQLKGGGHVVVWQAHEVIGSDERTDIWAKIYDADGNVATETFRINSFTELNQVDPDVTVLSNGNVLFSWLTDYDAEDDKNDFAIRIFTAEGEPVTQEWGINGSAEENVGDTRITALKDGGFVAVWTTSNNQTETDFRMAVFDNAGQKVSEEILHNLPGEGTADAISVTALENGGYAVAWPQSDYDYYSPGGTKAIKVQVFDKNGEAASDVFEVSGLKGRIGSVPDITEGPDGQLLVAWKAYTPNSSEEFGVFAKIIDQQGNELTGTIEVSDRMGSSSSTVEIAWLDDGNFVIAWSAPGDSDASSPWARHPGIWARVYSSDGDPLGDAFAVNQQTADNQSYLGIDALEGGRFVITWGDNHGGDAVRSRVFEGSGASAELPFGTEDEVSSISVADLLANDNDPDGEPLVFSLSSATSENGAALTYDPATGTVFYDPTGAAAVQALNSGETLTDSFTYTVTDPHGASSEATVTIVVGGKNEAFLAVDDQLGEMPVQVGDLHADDEFTVNETDFQHSIRPAVAAKGDGGAIVVWDVFSSSTGKSSSGIWGRITGADGSTSVAEFEVTGADVMASTPSVTLLDNGRFAVSWSESAPAENEYGYATVVKAQVFNADGSAGSSIFQVSGSYPGNQSDAEITTLSNGNIAIVWLSRDAEYDQGVQLKAAVYAPSGAAVAAEFVIDGVQDLSTGFLGTPQIAAKPEGGFMVSWNDTDSVRTAAFSNSGAETAAPSEMTADSGNGAFGSASVSVSDDGSYVVVWKHRDASDHHTGDASLHAAVYEADGSLRVEEFVIKAADGSMRYGTMSQVEVLPNGQFLVVWDAYPEPGNYAFDIYAQIFNPDGTAAGDEFKVNEYSSHHQYQADIAVLDDDSFMITWESYTAAHYSSSEIVARVFDLDGTVIEGHFSTEDEVAEISVQDLLANDDLGNRGDLIFALPEAVSEHGAALRYDAATGTVFYDPSEAEALQALAEGEALEDSFSYTLTGADGSTSTASVTVVVRGQKDVVVASDDRLFSHGPVQDMSLDSTGEWTISAAERENHIASDLAHLEGGGFVVVGARDGDSFSLSKKDGVWGQIFDASGSEVTAQFQISNVDGYYKTPKVADIGNGQFAVVWEVHGSLRDGDSSFGPLHRHVKARIYNEDGSPVTDVFLAAASETERLSDPQVAGIGDGKFVVSWHARDTQHKPPEKINAAVFDENGTRLTEDFPVSQSWESAGDIHSVTALADGRFTVAWQYDSLDDSTKETYFRIFEEDGQAVTGEMLVATGHGANYAYVETAPREDGGFIILWEDTDYVQIELKATIYDASGSVEVEDITLSTSSSSSNFTTLPDVEFLPNGQFVAVWNDKSEHPSIDGDVSEIWARVFNADGSPATEIILVNDQIQGYQLGARVAVAGEDSFVITWHSPDAEGTGSSEARAKIFSFDGTVVEEAFTDEDQVAKIDVAGLLENDDQAEADELIFALADAQSEYGAALSYDADEGTVFYDPTAAAGIQGLSDGEVLEDSFAYTISDGNGGTSTATVTIVVGGLDDPGTGISPEDHGMLI